MVRKKPPPPPPVQPLRLVGAARVIFLAGPFVLVTLMPFHELLGAACKYLGAWDEAVLLLMALSWAVLWRNGAAGPTRWRWLSATLLLFAFACLASAAANGLPGDWFTQARKLLPYPVLCLLIVNSRELMDETWRRRVLVSVVVAGAVAALWAIASYALFYHGHLDDGGRLSKSSAVGRVLLYPYTRRVELGRIDRAVGSFLNPNVLGSYLVVVATLCVGLLLSQTRKLPQVLLGSTAFVAVTALALTNSRGAMVGLLAASVVVALLRDRRVLAVPVVLLVLVAGLTPMGRTAERVSHVSQGDRTRLTKPVQAFQAIRDCRWLGKGLGTTGYSDMQYATLLFETGLVGLGCFLALLIAAFASCVQAARRPGQPLVQNVNASIAGVCLAGGVQGLAADYFATPQRACLFWLLIALAARSAQEPLKQLPPLAGEDEG